MDAKTLFPVIVILVFKVAVKELPDYPYKSNYGFHVMGTTLFRISDMNDFLQQWLVQPNLQNSLVFDSVELVNVSAIRGLVLLAWG